MLAPAGTLLTYVAEALGHVDARMMKKHFMYLAANCIHDAARANLPEFGVKVQRSLER
jgi:hypothetical protein